MGFCTKAYNEDYKALGHLQQIPESAIETVCGDLDIGCNISNAYFEAEEVAVFLALYWGMVKAHDLVVAERGPLVVQVA